MLGLFNQRDAKPRTGWFGKLRDGLKNTRSQLSGLFASRKIDETLFDELESALLSSDAGVEATRYLIEELRLRARRRGLETADSLREELGAILVELLSPLQGQVDYAAAKPLVIMIAGVNGTGKTTSIGKLGRLFKAQGKSVLLAAGDTFRAAAREQLALWGERHGLSVVSQISGDPAAVIYDAVKAAQARGIDVLIADTAGRLPTQLHLMEELKKIKRVIAKAEATAPHETWLVLDANTGQNALTQVGAFDDALGLTGLILTKLDGTAKGGVVAAIALARSRAPRPSGSASARDAGQAPSSTGRDAARGPLPILFVGVGEDVDDLRPFSAEEFVAALLDKP